MQFNPGDSIVSELKIDIKKGYIQKNDLAVLAIIAGNKWKRPIYFTSTQELTDLGLDKYVRMEGLSYRLVPVENPNNVQLDQTYKTIMEKFQYGNAQKKGVYYDEENRRHLNDIRQSHAILGMALCDAGRLDSARKELNKYDKNVQESNMPYGMTSNRGNFHNRVSMTFLYAAYRSGDLSLARKVHQSLKSDLEQQMKYYRSLGDEEMSNEKLATQASMILNNKPGEISEKQEPFIQDIYSSFEMLMQLGQWETQFKAGGKTNPNENVPGILNTPDSGKKPADSAKKKP